MQPNWMQCLSRSVLQFRYRMCKPGAPAISLHLYCCDIARVLNLLETSVIQCNATLVQQKLHWEVQKIACVCLCNDICKWLDIVFSGKDDKPCRPHLLLSHCYSLTRRFISHKGSTVAIVTDNLASRNWRGIYYNCCGQLVILVSRGHNPFGQHQESRPLASPNFLACAEISFFNFQPIKFVRFDN